MEPTQQLWSQVRARCQLGLEQLGMAADEQQLAQLVEYLRLLQQWNRSYNLTAVRDPLQAVDRHIIDSLSISPWLQPGAALDAGSGAGLPGIPQAIMHPAQRWLLLDSNGKKVRFLRHVARTLALANVAVLQQRLEQLRPADLAPDWCPAQIVSRAFAPLQRQCEWAQTWLRSGIPLLAMVGDLDAADISALPEEIVVAASVALPAAAAPNSAPDSVPDSVPDSALGQRHLLILRWRATA